MLGLWITLIVVCYVDPVLFHMVYIKRRDRLYSVSKQLTFIQADTVCLRRGFLGIVTCCTWVQYTTRGGHLCKGSPPSSVFYIHSHPRLYCASSSLPLLRQQIYKLLSEVMDATCCILLLHNDCNNKLEDTEQLPHKGCKNHLTFYIALRCSGVPLKIKRISLDNYITHKAIHFKAN